MDQPMTFTKRDYWETAVSQVAEHKILIRGYPLVDIMRHLTFTEAVHLTIRGRLPTENETKMLDAVLSAPIDHQFISSILVASRYIASGCRELIPSVAGGLLSGGRATMSPHETAAIIQETQALKQAEGLPDEEAAKRIVTEYRAQKKNIPGLGHPTHKDHDPRAEVIFELAEQYGFCGEKVQLYKAIHKAFVELRGKHLPINVDGAIAAVLTEMGWEPDEILGMNIIGIVPGMIAQCIEEITRGVPLRTIPDALARYTGEPERPLPAKR